MSYQYYDYDSNSTNSGGSGYSPYKDPTPVKKPKKSGGFFKTLLKTVAIALVFGLVAGGAFQGVNYFAGKTKTEEIPKTETTTEEKTEEPAEGKTVAKEDSPVGSTEVSPAATVTDVSQIVENVMPAIVQVTNMSIVEYRSWFGQNYRQRYESAGSGIIISQDNDYLYIASNNHVVEGATTLTITFCDEAAVEAQLQGTYPENDLAVIKVALSDISASTLDKIKVATIGDSDEAAVGTPAIVIGNALGYGQSVTTGVISALNRDVTFQNSDGSTQTISLLQTDAAVNPGNSGGALLNMKGEVIGVVSAKYSDTEVEGMGYAIPMSQARDIINQLMEKGTATVKKDDKEEAEETKGFGAYLGIAGVDLDSNTAYQYNMPTGVYVASVVEGSGSQAAGIEKGDVITAFQGKDILSMTELQEQIAKCHPGDTVKVSVAKANANFAITTYDVTLTEVIGD